METTMLFQIFLVIFVIYVIAVRLQSKNKKEKHRISKKVSTKLKRVPIFGHYFHFMGDGQARWKSVQYVGREAIYDNNGFSSFWIANRFFVVIADANAAELILRTSLAKDDLIKIVRPLIGNGSIYAPVSIWRPRRKFLSPNFNHKSLNFVRVFCEQGEILAEQLKSADGMDTVCLFDSVVKYALDSICEVLYGVEVQSQSNPIDPVSKAFEALCNLFGTRVWQPWLFSDKVYKWHRDYPHYVEDSTFLKQYVAKFIQTKRQNITQKNCSTTSKDQEVTENRCLLDFLMKSSEDKGLSDLEVHEECLMIMLAAIDTSSIAISFAALLLAKHPHIQDKLSQEINEVIGESKNIEVRDLQKLKYLEAVIKETLRLYPPSPVIVRKTEKNIALKPGLTLVPGVQAFIHIWAIHRNPKYWGPDENEFRPERFLEGPLKHPYSFLPFSLGIRNCIGSEYAMFSIKSALVYLTRKFKFLLPKELDIGTQKEFPGTFSLLLKHADNFELQIKLKE